MNGYDTKTNARIHTLTSLIAAILEGAPKNHSSTVTFAHLGSILDWIAYHRAAIQRLNMGAMSGNVVWDVPSPGGDILEILLKKLDRHEADTRALLFQALDQSKSVQK